MAKRFSRNEKIHIKAVVREVFSEGGGYADAVQELNRRGVKTTLGKDWSLTTLASFCNINGVSQRAIYKLAKQPAMPKPEPARVVYQAPVAHAPVVKQSPRPSSDKLEMATLILSSEMDSETKTRLLSGLFSNK